MITTNFIVSKRKISQENKVPFTGEYNIDKFHFTFDEEWNGLDKTLVIVTDDTHTYNVALLNDEAIVPMEFYQTKGNIIIGVFGTNGTEQILATGWLSVYIEDDAYKAGQEPSNLPTPTQWDLYVTEINELLERAEASEQSCQDILEEMKALQRELEDEVAEIERKLADGEFKGDKGDKGDKRR